MTTTSRPPLVRAGRRHSRHDPRGCGCSKFGFTVTRRRKIERNQELATKDRFPPFHGVAACCIPNPDSAGGLTRVREGMV